MAIKRRREKEEPKVEMAGMLRWLITYADLITLLLAMFITLYAASQVDIQKFKAITEAFSAALGGGIFTGGKAILHPSTIPGKPNIRPTPIVIFPAQPEIKRVYEEMGKYVKEKGLEGKVRLEMEERGLRISLITDEVLFDRGKADLKPNVKKILDKISFTLRNISNPIRIEGHTCNLPIKTSEFPSNWELSTRRATNVLRYLIENTGLPPRRLSAAGYADTKPLLPNTTEENRRFNRRVDIIVMSAEEWKKEPQ